MFITRAIYIYYFPTDPSEDPVYQSIAIKKDHGRIISAFVLEFVISIVSHNYTVLHVSVIQPY